MRAALGERGRLAEVAGPVAGFIKGEDLHLLAGGGINAGVGRAGAGREVAPVVAGDLLQAVIPVKIVLGGDR